MTKLSGVQRAAALLLTLGEEASTKLLKSLSTEEIKQLGSSMYAMQEVKMDVATELVHDFNQSFFGVGDICVPGGDFFRQLLPNVLDGDKAQDLMTRIERETEEIPFKNVRELDGKVLAGFIKNEHPQTIAIILAHLGNEKAGQVLGMLAEPMQFEVVNRIARLESVPQDLVREVDRVLQDELLSVGKGSSQILGGINMAAEIVNNCDKRTEENILQAMEDHDPELAEKVRKLMFVFEDLAAVTDSGIRELLKEVRNEELTLALKTASDELKNKVFKNLSQRAAQMLEEDISVMGPVRLSDVEAAQQNIINVARRLEKEGKIFLVSGEGGDTLV
jgi:flagellar motor switch protein FliG